MNTNTNNSIATSSDKGGQSGSQALWNGPLKLSQRNLVKGSSSGINPKRLFLDLPTQAGIPITKRMSK